MRWASATGPASGGGVVPWSAYPYISITTANQPCNRAAFGHRAAVSQGAMQVDLSHPDSLYKVGAHPHVACPPQAAWRTFGAAMMPGLIAC